ncbi:hypothetical protein D477_010336 [Arthrobacter crystallopoietes BAB-32]|uniref:Ribosomally synthesized peptide with SipW-like signal peptide n=1 Tax=Arthrobacter crystallopoietes BAB-32 TaxID=1246476 RepID=N1V7U7_9MICC|nr:hypothetical protein [Arthrobacter crystallopoietes]EMY34293.1 hypothetical protein D477_010336 [Arthrobacter crystallopoietes BAB-32]
MRNRVWLALAGAPAAAAFLAAGGTGALWQEAAMVEAGHISSGKLELLVDGQQEAYVFDALSSAHLVPGATTRAPLTISNGGDADLAYSLTGAATAGTADADLALAAALQLDVTDGDCTGGIGTEPVLYSGPLAAAAFSGAALAPSETHTICISVTLAADAPAAAAGGTTSATFTFKAEQQP